MMVGRVGVESFELLRIFYAAELCGIESAIGVQLHAQHVIDPDVRDDRADQVWALGQERAHEQAAIASALHGEFGRLGVIGANEKFSAGCEIVENMLLVGERSRLVPGFAKFAAAAEVCDGNDATLIEPNTARDLETWC